METGKKKLLVIINPISGSAHRDYMPEIVDKSIDKAQYEHVVRFTQGPGHATQLAKAAIEQGFHDKDRRLCRLFRRNQQE